VITMGADIYFKNGDYYRDSYNLSNLAWVIDFSYFDHGGTKKAQNAMMKKLALITDDQIKEHIKTRLRTEYAKPRSKDAEPFNEKEWFMMFVQKRNQLKALLDKNELKVKSWSA
jgi:hypothetical protein